MSNITLEEKNRISESNLHLFVERHIHDYWPCATNSARMIDFLQSQYGMTLEQYPYPLHLEEIETAFFYLQSQHMLFPRPADEPEPEDPEVTRERLAQQKVRDDFDARQRAEQLRIAKTMPLNELRNVIGVGDAAQRAQRRAETPIASRTLDDRESNRLTPQELDARARARTSVMMANPRLNRNSLEFSKLVAEEMAK